METFSALLALFAGNSPVTNEFSAQRPVTRIFDVFFDLCLNDRSSKQSWGWWFETPSRSLWRHCNETPHLTSHTRHQSSTPVTLLTAVNGRYKYRLKFPHLVKSRRIFYSIAWSTECTKSTVIARKMNKDHFFVISTGPDGGLKHFSG